MDTKVRRGVLVSLLAVVALAGCSSGGNSTTSKPESSTTTSAPVRRVYHASVNESGGDTYQNMQTLKPAQAPSGPPVYTAINLGPGCRRCKITDLSKQPVFNVGGTHITQRIIWRTANGDTLTGNFVGHYIQVSTTPLFTVGHQNKFVGRITIVGGTGAFAGARGTFDQTDTTTVLSVDTTTGLARKRDVNVTRGVVTYPPATQSGAGG